MQYKSGASTGESLYAPSQVCGVVCRTTKKGVRQMAYRQSEVRIVPVKP